MQAAGEHDIGMPCGVVEEEIYGDVELQLLETARDERVIRERYLRIEADRQQALDLAAVELAEQLVGVDARTGQLLLIDAPDASDVFAVLRVGDVAPAWKLIALLPVLATTLTVGLSDDRAVPALGFADSAGCENAA